MAKKHVNSPARLMAVQALYQSEITGSNISEMSGDETIIPDEGALPEYALGLLACIKEHGDEIDERIADASENWSLSRMPIVDRAILRAAVCEMLYIDEVPVSVSINEAVELAKVFGGEDESSRFVNGILGRIARSEDFDRLKAEGMAEEVAEEADEAAEEPAEEEAPSEQSQTEAPEDGQ